MDGYKMHDWRLGGKMEEPRHPPVGL